ncbi:MAG: hypothetical protein LW650_06605 [Planctomycetaceae bacterium]|jgi:hypothetical protein|nr:hypothetical protein [Phycisphaerales bacterium]MCE2653171.1 hypothetical protein [Planctomycetaceae bacterium]
MTTRSPTDRPEPPNQAQAFALLDALRAVPSPLTTSQQAEAFDDLTRHLNDVLKGRFGEAICDRAWDQLLRVVTRTYDAGKAERFTEAIMFALDVLSNSTSDAAVACIVRLGKANFSADHLYWLGALSAFGKGHQKANALFKALAKPLPEKFLAIALLEAANSAGRAGVLKSHPFNSPAGVRRLEAYLTSRSAYMINDAMSACGAIRFVAGPARKRLFGLAITHPKMLVRMEAASAGAQAGDASTKAAAVDILIERCLHRTTSVRAREYLEELGLRTRIPAEAMEPEFAAVASLFDHLSVGGAGRSPTNVKLIDHRIIYWPPTNDTRPVWLLRFTHRIGGRRVQPIHSVGMVGSMTWSFMDEIRPSMKPEHIYGLHCCLELEMNGDKRAPAKGSGKAGWALITAGPKARRRSR